MSSSRAIQIDLIGPVSKFLEVLSQIRVCPLLTPKSNGFAFGFLEHCPKKGFPHNKTDPYVSVLS